MENTTKDTEQKLTVSTSGIATTYQLVNSTLDRTFIIRPTTSTQVILEGSLIISNIDEMTEKR